MNGVSSFGFRVSRSGLAGRAALASAMFLAATAATVAEQAVYSLPPARYVARTPRLEAVEAVDLVRASSRLTSAQMTNLGPLTSDEQRLLASDSESPGGSITTLRRRAGLLRSLPALPGFSGALPAPAPGEDRPFGSGLLTRTADGRLAWTAAITSSGANALRLRVSGTALPSGSRLYLYTSRGEIRGPYSFEKSNGEGGLWTNSVEGETVYLELQLPASALAAPAAMRFSVDTVGHLAAGKPAPLATERPSSAINPCFLDVSCVAPSEFASVDLASHAVAQLNFASGGSFFICTGTLINATPNPTLPYLLTAHHCISTGAEAASLEALYNDKTAACNGSAPDRALLPRTLGATLVATGSVSDFTLLQLSQAPPTGAVLLGWTTQAVATEDGATFYRVSHPFDGTVVAPQTYAREGVLAQPASCGGLAYTDFIYSRVDNGGEGPGSSGSAAVLSDGRIVGQLFGTCGNPTTSCSLVQHVTGAFRTTYPYVAAFLNSGGTDACTPNDTTLCLSNNRYRVTATWQRSTDTGPGHAVPLTSDTGYFWFFSDTNVEMVLKVLNACSFATRYWVFAGGLTNVKVSITVTDTITGSVKTYLNPQNTAFQPVQDTSAFPTCP